MCTNKIGSRQAGRQGPAGPHMCVVCCMSNTSSAPLFCAQWVPSRQATARDHSAVLYSAVNYVNSNDASAGRVECPAAPRPAAQCSAPRCRSCRGRWRGDLLADELEQGCHIAACLGRSLDVQHAIAAEQGTARIACISSQPGVHAGDLRQAARRHRRHRSDGRRPLTCLPGRGPPQLPPPAPPVAGLPCCRPAPAGAAPLHSAAAPPPSAAPA